MNFMQMPDFWLSLLKIVGVNLLLSGENAIAIAMAARGLPKHQQRKAILLGAGFSVMLLTSMTFLASRILQVEYFEVIGGLLLLWVGIQMLSSDHAMHHSTKQHDSLLSAVTTIVLADFVMSLDNVIGLAATAKGNFVLLVLGLLVSVPVVMFGSTLVMRVMTRWPQVIVFGAALIGWIAGETVAADKAMLPLMSAYSGLHLVIPMLGALIVVVLGRWRSKKK